MAKDWKHRTPKFDTQALTYSINTFMTYLAFIIFAALVIYAMISLKDWLDNDQ